MVTHTRSVGVLRECVTEGSNTDDASQARLTALAARFEDNVYRTAKTSEDYFHQIANKMYNLKRKKNVPGGDPAKAGVGASAQPVQGAPAGRTAARTHITRHTSHITRWNIASS
jgi:hypothetical protein